MKRQVKIKRIDLGYSGERYAVTYTFEVEGWWDHIVLFCDDYIVKKTSKERYLVELYCWGRLTTALHANEVLGSEKEKEVVCEYSKCLK